MHILISFKGVLNLNESLFYNLEKISISIQINSIIYLIILIDQGQHFLLLFGSSFYIIFYN